MIYSKYFLLTCLGIVPKMKSLELSNPETWNYLNNGCFSLRMEAYNSFERIAIEQVIRRLIRKLIKTHKL